MQTNPSPKPGFTLAKISVLLAFTVVILGAFTRLVDAGLGCPDWPVCYGHILWPMSEQEVAVANAAFPETPVEHDKTWPEQVHRLFASSLGLVCIAFVGISIYQNKVKKVNFPVYQPILLLALVILQGMFGMWTVTLNLWPQVVTAHLLGGFATLTLLWVLMMRFKNNVWMVDNAQYEKLLSLRPFFIVALVVLVTQIALGGWTSSNYAALACPDLPTCQTKWLPNMNFAEGFNFAQDIGPNYLGGVMDSDARTAIHFAHRVGAIVTTVVLLIYALRLRSVGNLSVRHAANAVVIVLTLQVLLGLSNIIFHLPLWIAVSHNAVGALLLLTLVRTGYGIYSVQNISRY